MNRAHANWVIYTTLLVALALHMLPFPFDWRMFRPPWVELTLFYWVLALPHRVGIISSALTGLAVDVIDGSPVGALSLGLVSSTLIVLLNYQRIRQFDVLQQILAVLMLVALARTTERWAHNLVGLPPTGAEYLLPLFSVPILWPLLRPVLRGIRRQWEVT